MFCEKFALFVRHNSYRSCMMSCITFTNRSLLCAVMLPQVRGELAKFIGAALAVFCYVHKPCECCRIDASNSISPSKFDISLAKMM
jgi:hypothetical protein